MTYNDAVRYLYSLGNEVQTAKLGLDRISRVLDGLGNPHRAGRFIHVAGTNGKGSTCAMVEAGLRAAGLHTGLYTSPHLVEPVERIRIAGEPVSKADFAAAFEAVHQTSQRLLDAGVIDLHPTYFESVTAMAFLLLRDAGVPITVLEVGLGGRLDATNVVTPELCVITPVDYDHEQYLGRTLYKIASEKAGILKPGVPAIIARQHSEARRAILERSAAVSAPLTWTSEYAAEDVDMDARGTRFRVRGHDVVCPLPGEHQLENALTAAAVLDHLRISPAGIAGARWPGRLERVREQPEVILDGAHNLAGTRALAAYIEQFYFGRRIWIIYGVMRDKAVQEMTEILFPLAERVIATTPANARALPAAEIPGGNVERTASVREALALIGDAFPTDVIFITGSLFLVGEARALLVQ